MAEDELSVREERKDKERRGDDTGVKNNDVETLK